MRYARVVIGLPIEGPFLYSIPDKFKKCMGVGRRVIVPFRKQRVVGYIVGFSSTSGIKKKIKEIEELIDKEQTITSEILKLTRWMADYYFCAWGEAIEAALPPILRKGKIKIKSAHPNPVIKNAPSAICRSMSTDRKLVQGSGKRKARRISLQECALKRIEESLVQNRREVFLLQYMSGRDRLNIYFKAIEFNLKQGKSSIILIPEISLISPVESQLRLKFGDGAVASVHSRLSPSRLYQEWRKIKTGESSIVVGSRSAIFAPLKNLKLIIMDEEADSSYKQIEVPRYNAREVAFKRAELSRAVVVLGTIAPSIESYLFAKTKEYRLIASRLYRKGPELKVIDMRREYYKKQKTRPIISRFMESKIREVLSQKQKIVLFLNRRGFATFIYCSHCKAILRCKNCNTVLKHHFKQHLAICHQCGYCITAPEICPQCNVSYVRYAGSGTQRLESELHRLFPYARTLRIDTDALSSKVNSRYKEVDILAGTKAINKIHFNPPPKLIGIISLDTLLNISDFRASERTFQLLMRFVNLLKKDGFLLIQTYFPENSILRFVSQKEYAKFYEEELSFRRDLSLPPFRHIAILTLRGKGERRLTQRVQRLASFLIKKKPRGMNIIGPMPAPISKLRGKYQQNIIIKAKKVSSINKFLKENLGGFTKSRIGSIPLTVDIDPL